MRLVSLVLGCALTYPALAGWVTVSWSGTPGVTALRSGCVAPGQYERAPIVIAGTMPGTVVVPNLPDTGLCYFALNAGPQDEWIANFSTLQFAPALPGAVGNLTVTWVPTPTPPPVSLGVEIKNVDASVGELDLTLTGTGSVTLALLGTVAWDWCKPGGEFGTVATPTTPALGIVNNDGFTAKAITLTAPVTTRCDYDPNLAFPGINATANGVTRPLVNNGTSWTVNF